MQTPPSSLRGGGGSEIEEVEILPLPFDLPPLRLASPSVFFMNYLLSGNAERSPREQQRDADAIVVMMRSLLVFITCNFDRKFTSLFSSLPSSPTSFTFNSFFESSSPSAFAAFVVLIMQLLTSLRGFLETDEGHAAASKIFLSLIEIADLTASAKIKNNPRLCPPSPSSLKSLFIFLLTSGPFIKMVSSDYKSWYPSSKPLLPFYPSSAFSLDSFQKAFKLLEFEGDLFSLTYYAFGPRPIFSELLMILLFALYEGVYVSETLTPPFETVPHNLRSLPESFIDSTTLINATPTPPTPPFGKSLEAFFKSYSEEDNTDAMVEMFCCFRRLLPFFFPPLSLPI